MFVTFIAVSVGQPGMAVMGNLAQPTALGVPGGQGILAQPGVGNATVYSVATPLGAAPPQYTNQQLGLNLQVIIFWFKFAYRIKLINN